MPWGAAIGAGISLLGDEMKSDKNGGAGGKSSAAEPWAPATPWLLQNLVQGQGLQQQYTDRPFSARQQAAYDNQYALSDYGRQLVPSLLDQMGSQPVGFDKNNRTARPQAWDWNALAEGLGQRAISNVQEPAPAPKAEGEFSQHQITWLPAQQALIDSGRSPWLLGGGPDSFAGGPPGTVQATGGYGGFKYGADVKPGTKEYRDMQEYLLHGGVDPYGLYGAKNFGGQYGFAGGLMGNSGNSVGGSAAADGSGGGGPGAF
ncbi:hypothetical protein J7E62_09190 [Variovorax paradoxus]|nr:hypothetical protein [Variovorax paradoxus]